MLTNAILFVIFLGLVALVAWALNKRAKAAKVAVEPVEPVQEVVQAAPETVVTEPVVETTPSPIVIGPTPAVEPVVEPVVEPTPEPVVVPTVPESAIVFGPASTVVEISAVKAPAPVEIS